MPIFEPSAASIQSRAFDTPWKISTELRRYLALPLIRGHFALHGVPWGQRWRMFGAPIIQRHRGSTILIGDDVTMRSWRTSNPLSPNHAVVLATRTRHARIVIGRGSGFTGTTIVSAALIEIGDRVSIGANSTVIDSDFHPLDPHERARAYNAGRVAPVVIDDDVFIGMNCLILKGVHVGSGSVVGAGSVVCRNVPSGVIVAGNPAVVLGPVR